MCCGLRLGACEHEVVTKCMRGGSSEFELSHADILYHDNIVQSSCNVSLASRGQSSVVNFARVPHSIKLLISAIIRLLNCLYLDGVLPRSLRQCQSIHSGEKAELHVIPYIKGSMMLFSI